MHSALTQLPLPSIFFVADEGFAEKWRGRQGQEWSGSGGIGGSQQGRAMEKMP